NATSTSESFSVPQVTTSTCTYAPSPSSGSIAAGSTQTISFSCLTVTFTESGLPSGTSWSVTYNGVTKSSTSSSITFNATSTSESFSVPQVTTSTCTYAPSPSSGSIAAGSTQTISFSCIPTVFVINITNTQNVATPNPFQQMINVSSSSPIWPYINTNQTSAFGQNAEFIYPNGTVIPSWLESYSSNNAIWWIKIGSIPANSKLTIYAKIAPKSTNLFNGVTVGEAPQLSPTYGEYDNGANVFYIYANFQGNSMPSGWTAKAIVGSYTPTFIGGTSSTGGIEMMNDVGGQATALKYNNPFTTQNIIIEASWMYSGTADNLGFGIYAKGISYHSGGFNPASIDGYYASYEYWRGPASPPGLVYASSNGSSVTFYAQASSHVIPTSGTNYMFTQVIITPNSAIMNFVTNTNSLYQTPVYSGLSNVVKYYGTPVNPGNIFYIGASTGGAYSYIYLYWLRVRAYPPNGVMPSVSIG
ncbi:MAG: hypothetical protein OH318_02100, partial [Candidatus Parvarchaeota archaeon]|nr:hypothetical protein [Candidatus Rehaiarchaeum fermentans]